MVVLTVAVSLKHNFPAKDQLRRSLHGALPLGVALLRSVDAAETDTVSMVVVQE